MRQNTRVNGIQTMFSGTYIDRLAELRTDANALRTALAHADTRFIALWKQLCLADDHGPIMLSRHDLNDHKLTEDAVIFLGRLDKRYVFSIALDNEDEPSLAAGCSFKSLRELGNTLKSDALGLLAYARAMTIWQQRHHFCGICGSRNLPSEGGFVLRCSNTACDHRVFPRLDPAIIVLVHDGTRCLLGRQASWPERRFSTIAGFVEPGESLEDAVRREVREETDIAVGECTYVASQPWPFPSSLMIGYHAVATSERIRLNDGELADACWVSREDIAERRIGLPTRWSVAYQLIEAWYDHGDRRSLASLRGTESG